MSLSRCDDLEAAMEQINSRIEEDIHLLISAGIEFGRITINHVVEGPFTRQLCLDGKAIQTYSVQIVTNEEGARA